MTKFCSLPHTSIANRRSGEPARVRAALVFALIVLILSLPFHALAQGEVGVKSDKFQAYTAFTDGAAFVIYQGANGETVCRDATPDEARALHSGTSNVGLHQINHLKKDLLVSPSQTIESATGLTIILRATQQLEQNAEAKAAFIAAAAKWEALIKDPITIVIDVDFGTTAFGQPFSSSNVLGATSIQVLFFNGNYTDIRGRLFNHASSPQETAIYNALPATNIPTDIGNTNTVLVVSPILRALGAISPVADPANETNFGPTPHIAFNSAFGFDFDPTDGITNNRTDFDAVAVHEIGHALGFSSEVGARELDSSQPIFATIWDLFRFRPATADLNNFSIVQRILSSGGEHVEFNGGAEVRLSSGRPDGNGGDGEQASHWKDDVLNGGVFIGIMDPSIARNRRETMTANDENAIDSFGYTINATPRPPNDDFGNAVIVSGNSGTISGTNVFATSQPGEPIHSPDGVPSGKSIWYRWTAPNSGLATFTTAGSRFDTLLAVYTGTSVSGLTLIARNDDADNANQIYTSSVQFIAAAGTTYQIAVDGYAGSQGNTVLNWSLSATTTVSIGGRVANQDGTSVSGLQIFLSGSQSGISITDANGNYLFSNLNAGGNYTVGPGFQGGTISFTPNSYSFNNLITDQTANFVRNVAPTFNITGRVTDQNGNGIAGISIEVPGSTTPIGNLPILPTATDANGYYVYNLPGGGNYNVTPTTSEYSYTPPFITFTNLGANQAANFTATRPTVDLYGRVIENGIGLQGVTMTLLHGANGTTRTTVTGSDGRYQFVDLIRNDIYNIIPVKDGYSFNPPSLIFPANLSDMGDIVARKLLPIETSDFFVRQHYIDFLNREADAPGLTFWKNQIDECETRAVSERPACREIRRINVSAAFFLSIEFHETGYLVYRIHKAAYGDAVGVSTLDGSHQLSVPVILLNGFLPDAQSIGRNVVVGQTGWEQTLENNKQTFMEEFVQRSRFIAAYPLTQTPAEFVDALNATAGGVLSPAERNQLVSDLASGAKTRGQVLRAVAEDPDLNSAEINRAFVLMQYFGYLRRNPKDAPDVDYTGYDFWLSKLNQFNGNFINAEMVKAFISSIEYQQRFAP